MYTLLTSLQCMLISKLLLLQETLVITEENKFLMEYDDLNGMGTHEILIIPNGS